MHSVKVIAAMLPHVLPKFLPKLVSEALNWIYFNLFQATFYDFGQSRACKSIMWICNILYVQSGSKIPF